MRPPRRLPDLLARKHQELKVLLLGVWAFNLIDAMCAYRLMELGDVELNPLMRWAYGVSPAFFLQLKIAMCSIGVVALWAFRNDKGAHIVTRILFSFYLVLAVLQVIVVQMQVP